jgi:hypothetical protein
MVTGVQMLIRGWRYQDEQTGDVHMKWAVGSLKLGVLGLLFIASWSAEAAAQDVPIVYVRCPRSDAAVEVTGDVTVAGVTRTASRTMRGFDAYDFMPEVSFFHTGFTAPCDLVYREPSGTERILFDCTSQSTTGAAGCAALDPAVSFDGRTVAFTVFRGTLNQSRGGGIAGRVLDPAADPNTYVSNRRPETFPNRYLAATESQLHLVDVATGEVTELPHVAGEFDSGPAFLPGDRLAFTSTRDGNRCTVVWTRGDLGRGTRIWTMDLDGRNIDLASHHSLSQEQHPIVLRDGRVAYASWQIFGTLPFRHTNGDPGGSTSLANLFHVYTQAPDGAGNFAFYGQHSGDHNPSYFGSGHNAAHFLGQTSDSRVWTADYYRANNFGLGSVVGIMPEPEGQEGLSPEEAVNYSDVYAPRDAILFARWSHPGDVGAFVMPEPAMRHPNYADPLPWAGKVGHPAPLPDNGLMLVWGKGACSQVSDNAIFDRLGQPRPSYTSGSGAGTPLNLVTSLGIDTPSCDLGIYRATVIPSVHPSDLEMVVDRREWHELMARAVVPYSEIYGVERPDIIPRADTRVSRSDLEVGTPFGLLGAASIIDRETHPDSGIHFAGEHQFAGQGTDTINYRDEDLCGVRILGVMPNRSREAFGEIRNVAGERLAILGEVSVRNREAAGAPVHGPDGEPDTSFLVRMPANTPYLMQAIDCEGRTLNTDQSWQHLRPGEMKTCGGCHVHSRPARNRFEDTFAATANYAVAHFGEGQVPLLAGERDGQVATRTLPGYGLQIDFLRDIMPIFERRCVSCHGGASPAGSLALDRPAEVGETPSTHWCLLRDRHQTCVPEAQRMNTGVGAGVTFRRPQMTRYIRALNSLGSLLYWKAAGRRTDGNTDETFTDADPVWDRDLDFGVPHTTEITPEELGLLSRWIDLGAPGGPMELLDTQKPTLHLAATVEGGEIQQLRVGTVDLGSGIAPTTLTVCFVRPDGVCEDLSGDAELHGVTAVDLPHPLSDPAEEVLARVADVTGNITEVRRTVGWLLNTPPPAPSTPDGGPGSGDVDAGTHGGRIIGGCGCAIRPARGQGAWLFVGLIVVALVRRRLRPRASH